MGRRFFALGAAVLMGGLLVACNPVQPWHNELVSINAAGADSGNARSFDPAISADGTRIVFVSGATDLVPGGAGGIYVRDVPTGTTIPVSVDNVGVEHGGFAPSISPDGTKVAFVSSNKDIVPGGVAGNGYHLYLRDLTAGVTTRVSTGPPNGWVVNYGAVFDADGSTLAYAAGWASFLPPQVVVYDVATATNTLVSADPAGGLGNGFSWFPVISPDGTKVAFSSSASNLGPTDTNGQPDIYVRDLATGTTTLPVISTSGDVDASGFSADSTKIAVTAGGRVFLADLPTGTATEVSISQTGVSLGGQAPDLSADGTLVSFTSTFGSFGPTDTNNATDVYLRDVAAGTTELVSQNAAGTDAASGYSATGVLSDDGTKVAFVSWASDLGPKDSNAIFDVYVRDRLSDTTTLVSSNGDRTDSAGLGGLITETGIHKPHEVFDAAGRHLVFETRSNDLGPTDSSRSEDPYQDGDIYLATLRGADLVTTLTADPSPAPTGSDLSYTVTVVNRGPDAGPGSEMVLALPDGVDVSIPSGEGVCVQSPTHDPPVVICQLGTLAPGDDVTIVVDVTVVAPAGTTLRATAAAVSDVLDPAGANNAVYIDTTVN